MATRTSTAKTARRKKDVAHVHSKVIEKESRRRSSLRRMESDPTLSMTERVEQVLIGGDLSPLTPQERVSYYRAVCKSLGLNPLTQPFTYILFREGDNSPAKLQLYANKDCAAQLRMIHRISVSSIKRDVRDGMSYAEAFVNNDKGKTDCAMGVVPLWKWKDGNRVDLSGREYANAILKTETKAKRRATLSVCGLAFLDESELDTMHVVGGVTPDGRIYQFQEAPQLDEHAAHGHPAGSPQAQQAEATLARVEEEDRKLMEEKKAPPAQQPAPQQAAPQKAVPTAEGKKNPPPATKPEPWKFAGSVEIDWTNPQEPIVRGDLDGILGEMQANFGMAHYDDWWHIVPKDVSRLKELCVRVNYEIREIRPAKSSVPAAEATTKRSGAATPPRADSSAALSVVAGTIERVNAGMAGKYPVRQVTLILADKTKPTYSCFDKGLFEELDKGLGKEAQLLVKQNGKYVNITGLRKIGSREWLEDGTPVVQRDREPGRTLFP